MLFSKSGFTNELVEAAGKMGNVELVDLKKMFLNIKFYMPSNSYMLDGI